MLIDSYSLVMYIVYINFKLKLLRNLQLFLLYYNNYNIPNYSINYYECAKFIAHAQIFITCVINNEDEQRSVQRRKIASYVQQRRTKHIFI